MTQANVDAGWFLKFKRKADCDAAAPCNIAAYNAYNNPKAPLIPCNKTAPRSAPNCAYCCNFSVTGTGAYNEPIGGGEHGSTRFGNNALGVRDDASSVLRCSRTAATRSQRLAVCRRAAIMLTCCQLLLNRAFACRTGNSFGTFGV